MCTRSICHPYLQHVPQSADAEPGLGSSGQHPELAQVHSITQGGSLLPKELAEPPLEALWPDVERVEAQERASNASRDMCHRACAI